MLKNILLTFLVFAAQAGVASDNVHKVTVEEGVVLSVKAFRNNRSLPHAFYDQAVSSIPKLYPEHVYYAKRRYGHLGKMQYSIICYKETNLTSMVQITGTAVLKSNAWSFETYVPESSFGDKLLIVLEAVENFPSNKSLKDVGALKRAIQLNR